MKLYNLEQLEQKILVVRTLKLICQSTVKADVALVNVTEGDKFVKGTRLKLNQLYVRYLSQYERM